MTCRPWLIHISGLLFVGTLILFAATDASAQVFDDDGDYLIEEWITEEWGEPQEFKQPVPFKEGYEVAPAVDDDIKEVAPPPNAVYLPLLGTNRQSGVHAAAADDVWQLVKYEGFEGAFPNDWLIWDANGTYGGSGAGAMWDDTNEAAYVGSWSVHSNGGAPYANNTDTYMRYGPFDLTGATGAYFEFYQYVDTEEGYDFFTWEFSCNGGSIWKTSAWSGSTGVGRWAYKKQSLYYCRGYSSVYVRFGFKSDYSLDGMGVYLDEFRIWKKVP